ncbi:MAG: polysaccharide biosynthesis tyrosine autokinase [Bacteroidetes bacterium]|nr:polysaccharide biosynthesis tyrosine autokinase [Bacteroidota bacterium]
MNFKKEYNQLIAPLIKNSPVIIILMVLALLATRRAITYMTPEYRAEGAIKINNQNQATFGIFSEDNGSSPNGGENFLTEVEVFRSKDLVKKALQQLDWELSVFRVGKLRLVELDEECPFTIEYADITAAQQNKLQYFDYLGNDRFRLRQGGETDSTGLEVALGEPVNQLGLHFTIHKNEAVLAQKPNCLNEGDRFAFKINSLDALADRYAGEKLFVKPVEKDISIVKIYFNHELPEKAQAFVNELMETYIREGEQSKKMQADSTLAFLDQQLAEVGAKLRSAEANLSGFRGGNQVINFDQETDATLKELTQLDLRRIDLDMKYAEMERLQTPLFTGKNLQEFSPNFEALQDPIFRETFFKAQGYEALRKDLLQQYTPTNPAVANVDEKIKESRTFLNETLITTMNNIRAKQDEVDQNLRKLNADIKRFPEKERNFVALEREVSLNENMYNHLMRKRTELAIVKASDLYPHKIIEHAERPKQVVSPNKSLLYGLSALFAMLLGMTFAYVRSFFKDRIKGKDDLDNLPVPMLGSVYQKLKKHDDGFALVSGLVASIDKLPDTALKHQGKLLVTTSMLPAEGKSFTATELAKAYAAVGKRVLVVDMDVRKPTLHLNFKVQNTIGYCDVLEGRVYALNAIQKTTEENLYILTAGRLESQNYALLFNRRSLDFIYDFRWHFDVVIVDTPPLGVFEDSLPIMSDSTANLFVIRAGFTKKRMLDKIANLTNDFHVPNLYIVLNGQAVSSKVPGYKRYMKKYYNIVR